MKAVVLTLLTSLVSSTAAAQASGPAMTSSLARDYYTSHETDAGSSGPTATSAKLPFSSATADYGRLTAEATGIPSQGGTGRPAYAGAFGASSVSDLLFFDFGSPGRPPGPLSLSFDFSVRGQRPMLDIPPLPANVGFMNAAALWNLTVQYSSADGEDRPYRLYGCCEGRDSRVTILSKTSGGPITGDFNLTIPYAPGGGHIGQVPISYSLYCGVDNQQIVVAGAQANCLGWSFDITAVHLVDPFGQVVPDVVISAASTYDYNGSGQPIIPPTNVPEPSTWSMIIMGFLVVGTCLRRTGRRGLASAGV